MGTPAFAARRQLRGEALDVRCRTSPRGRCDAVLPDDGRAPIEETDLVRLVARIGQEAPPSPRGVANRLCPPETRPFVARAVWQKRPAAKRFETYADLSTALALFSSLASTPARIGPRPGRVARFLHHRPCQRRCQPGLAGAVCQAVGVFPSRRCHGCPPYRSWPFSRSSSRRSSAWHTSACWRDWESFAWKARMRNPVDRVRWWAG